VIASLQSGKNPLGITSLYVTPAREKIIAFRAIPHGRGPDRHDTRLSSKLKGPMDLCGLRTGVNPGSVELGYFTTLSAQCVKAGKKAISISVYQDISTVYLSLAQGRLDFTSGAAELTPPVLKEYPGKLVAGFLVTALSFTVALGVAKKQAKVGPGGRGRHGRDANYRT